MVRAIKYFFIIFLLVSSYHSFAAEPVYGNSDESKYAREFTPRKGKATVYILETHGSSGVSPQIWLNNYEVGRILPGSFAVWQMPAGTLNVRVDGAKPDQLSLLLGAGNAYLIRLSVRQSSSGPIPQLIVLPASYRGDLARYKWLKNPRDVTQLAGQPAVPVAPVLKAKPEPRPATQAVKPEQTVEKQSDVSTKPTQPIKPGGVAILVKAGALTISEESQTILSVDRTFDDSASSPFAVEAYYQYGSGFTIGGEIISYTAQFTSTGLSDVHDVDVLAIIANAKKYFRSRSSFQLFIGAGIGAALTDVSGPTVTGNTASVSYQLMAGVEYRTQGIGIFAEYKFINADTESDSGETIDVSSSGLFAGVAFHF